MATINATKVSSGALTAMPGVGDGQSAKVVASRYDWSVAPAAGDIIQSPLIQAGSVITDVKVVHTGLGASGTFEVGYGDDTDYFVVSASQATGGVVRDSAPTAMPLVLAANDSIDVKINAAGASASGSIAIIVTFLPRNA